MSSVKETFLQVSKPLQHLCVRAGNLYVTNIAHMTAQGCHWVVIIQIFELTRRIAFWMYTGWTGYLNTWDSGKGTTHGVVWKSRSSCPLHCTIACYVSLLVDVCVFVTRILWCSIGFFRGVRGIAAADSLSQCSRACHVNCVCLDSFLTGQFHTPREVM